MLLGTKVCSVQPFPRFCFNIHRICSTSRPHRQPSDLHCPSCAPPEDTPHSPKTRHPIHHNRAPKSTMADLDTLPHPRLQDQARSLASRPEPTVHPNSRGRPRRLLPTLYTPRNRLAQLRLDHPLRHTRTLPPLRQDIKALRGATRPLCVDG